MALFYGRCIWKHLHANHKTHQAEVQEFLLRRFARGLSNMSVIADAVTYLIEHPGFIMIGLLLYVFVFAVSLLFSGPKPGEAARHRSRPNSVSLVDPRGNGGVSPPPPRALHTRILSLEIEVLPSLTKFPPPLKCSAPPVPG